MPAEVAQVLRDREATGKLSKGSRQILLRYPEYAAVVPDSENATIEEGPTVVEQISVDEAARLGLVEDDAAARKTQGTSDLTSAAATAGAFYCAETTVTHREPSTLGATLYRFSNYLKWCYQQGGTVHQIAGRSWNISDTSFTVEWQGIIDQAACCVNNTNVTSYYQGYFKHCYLNQGCWGSTYPKVRITGYNNGTRTYTTSS